MKIGIVGLPNVGKSTMFNAITNAGAESANYPFCTIEPNIGVVNIHQAPRFSYLKIAHENMMEYRAPFYNVYRINSEYNRTYISHPYPLFFLAYLDYKLVHHILFYS